MHPFVRARKAGTEVPVSWLSPAGVVKFAAVYPDEAAAFGADYVQFGGHVSVYYGAGLLHLSGVRRCLLFKGKGGVP